MTKCFATPIFEQTTTRALSVMLALPVVLALGACDDAVDSDDALDDAPGDAQFVDPDLEPGGEPDAGLALEAAPGSDPETVACVPPVYTVNPRLSLIDTIATDLNRIDMPKLMSAIATNAGYPATPIQTYNRVINNFEAGSPALGSRCDDSSALFGGPGLNGYPLQCPRAERSQDFAPGPWFPIAAVNRFDLAPADGSNCGEQRLIMASNAGAGGTGRMFMIFEAVIPNPDPACGLQACRPIAEFWERMSSDPTLSMSSTARALELEQAFLTGHATLMAAGFGPFMSADNLTFGSGQVRTNNFDQPPWTLRDHKFGDQAGQLVAFQTPVEGNAFGPLWNDTSPWPQGGPCRADILAGLGDLLPNDVNLMGIDTGNACWAAESIDDTTADYEARLLAGSGAFRSDIGAELGVLGSSLVAEEVTRRATYVGSCMGCHQPTATMSTLDLGGGVFAEPSLGFVHVSETLRQTCLTPLDCFRISPALTNSFLPAREATLTTYLSDTFCTGCTPGAIDDSLDVAAKGDPSGPSGGQVRVPNIDGDEAIEALLEYERALEGQRGPTIGGAPASRMH